MPKKKTNKKKRKVKHKYRIRYIFFALFIFVVIMGILLMVIKSHEDSNNDGALIDDVIQGEVQELDLSNKDVKYLYELFVENTSFKLDYAIGLNSDIYSRLYYTYLSFNEDDFKQVSCNDAGLVILYDEDNYFKALCSTNTTYPMEIDEMERVIRDNYTYGINNEDFEKRYKEIFGNVEYSTHDFEYSIGQTLHYDSRTDMYLKYHSETGGVAGISIEGTFKKATLRRNKLIITISYLTEDLSGTLRQYDVAYQFEKDKDTDKFIFMKREEK